MRFAAEGCEPMNACLYEISTVARGEELLEEISGLFGNSSCVELLRRRETVLCVLDAAAVSRREAPIKPVSGFYQ